MNEEEEELRIVRILAVDDHEMTTTGYKYILEAEPFNNFEVSVEIATSFEAGKEKIEFSARSLNYDIILLDIHYFLVKKKIFEVVKIWGFWLEK